MSYVDANLCIVNTVQERERRRQIKAASGTMRSVTSPDSYLPQFYQDSVNPASGLQVSMSPRPPSVRAGLHGGVCGPVRFSDVEVPPPPTPPCWQPPMPPFPSSLSYLLPGPEKCQATERPGVGRPVSSSRFYLTTQRDAFGSPSL